MRKTASIAILLLFTAVIAAVLGCGGGSSAPFNSNAFGSSSKKYIYVASGSCYGGGVATAAGPTNTVARFNLEDGTLDKVVIDYNFIAGGDSPVSILDYDDDHLLVLVENTGGRHIDLVKKDGSGYSTFLVNGTALNGVSRAIIMLADMGLLVSKSTAIEKFSPLKVRIMSGANPYINAPAAPCAASATLISSMAVGPTGKIVYTHAAATPNNRIGVINPAGYSIAADCLASTAGPVATALPTRAIFHSTGKLLVTYGSTTAASNLIYSYDVNPTTGAITAPTSVYSTNTVVNGPSSMTEDPDTGDVYVSNVTSTFNTIEKFTFDGTTMTRVGTQPYMVPNTYNRCMTDIKVAN